MINKKITYVSNFDLFSNYSIKKNFSNSKSFIKNYIGRKDHMISGYFKDGSSRFVLSDISETLNEARIRFNINDPVKLSQLGIAYNTSLTVNSFLNGEERVKFLCQYYNKMNNISMLTTIYSESIATGEVRGFIEETNLDQINFNEKDEDEENSFLKISKILYHHTSEVYGVVKLRNSTKLTEDDIYSYFEESEQIRTHTNFNFKNISDYESNSFLISQSFMLQKMPDFSNSEIHDKYEQIRNNKFYKEIQNEGLNFTRINNMFEDLKFDVEMRRTPIQFYCRCSKDQIKKSLIMLQKDEILDMKEKNQNSIECKICNTEYILNVQDFEYLLNNNN